MSAGERGRLLTIVLWNGKALLQPFFVLLFIVAIFFRLSSALICSDDVIVNAFIEFLNSVVSSGGISRSAQNWGKDTCLELNGSSELRTQLLIENCSKKSLRR